MPLVTYESTSYHLIAAIGGIGDAPGICPKIVQTIGVAHAIGTRLGFASAQ